MDRDACEIAETRIARTHWSRLCVACFTTVSAAMLPSTAAFTRSANKKGPCSTPSRCLRYQPDSDSFIAAATCRVQGVPSLAGDRSEEMDRRYGRRRCLCNDRLHRRTHRRRFALRNPAFDSASAGDTTTTQLLPALCALCEPLQVAMQSCRRLRCQSSDTATMDAD